MNTLESLRQIPEHELTERDQDNYLLVLTFDELHHCIEQGYNEDVRSWLDFYAGVVVQAKKVA